MLLAAAISSGAVVSAQSSGYGGVVPGSGNLPESVTARPGGGESVVTWPGFQMLPDGGSRVFVQTTLEVKPELKRSAAGWLLMLPGCSLPQGNARLPLDTQYFNTPLTSVRAKTMDAGVGIILDVRDKAEPRVRTEKGQNGFFFVYVEFAPGQYK
jgi:hypothetical protein